MASYTVRQIVVHPQSDQAEARTFEIDEDAFIVDAEYRGTHRLVLAVAEPAERRAQAADAAEDDRCAYVTDSGERCSRSAQAGSDYCWQHQEEER